jgi:AcrR family transcriptional regulator
MLETPEEIDRLQQLLDRSAAGAGPHMKGIITGERRLSADQLCQRLQGMKLLVVATVTADGRPLAGPVDGYFLHGSFYFGSGRDSVRTRHLAARPAVSAHTQQTIGLLSENLADRWSVRKGPPVCKILGMTVFQRARSEEQREVRRQAILGAAAAMLDEMPVAQVTLNELSRRAGLAKSNVLRYFESREAVLLELLDSAWQDWLAQLERDLGDAVDAAPLAGRADQLAAALAGSLAAHPMLCDLISAQAAVLEHNVSPEVAAQYKRASIAGITKLGRLLLAWVPELGEQDAIRLAGATVMMTSALWPHTQPSAAMLTAYEADPELAAMRLDFTSTIREVLQVMISGLLVRSSR